MLHRVLKDSLAAGSQGMALSSGLVASSHERDVMIRSPAAFSSSTDEDSQDHGTAHPFDAQRESMRQHLAMIPAVSAWGFLVALARANKLQGRASS